MNSTLTVRPQRSRRWIYAALLVAGILATIALYVAVFAGGNDAPAAPTPVVNTAGVDSGCVPTGPSMRAC
jgi:hypothetical protein